MSQDPYQTLGVSKSATQEDIVKAYRTLASRWHPDKNPSNPSEASEKFKQIAAAFEVIGDKQRRRNYDFYGTGQFPAFNFRSRNAVDDIFDNLFPQFFGGRGNKSNASRSRVKVSLAEAFTGCTKVVKSEKHEPCATCSATGSVDWSRCTQCDGSGFLFTSDGPMRIQTSCTQCSGKGSNSVQSCHECNGRGYRVAAQKDVALPIPPGAEDGMQVRISGESPDGGDLFVVVGVEKDARLTRQQRNLFGSLEVPYTVLVLGGEAKFDLFGSVITVKIPRGTKSGTRIRLASQGMPHIQNPSARGDLFLDVILKLPEEITKEHERILMNLAKLESNS